MVTPAEQTLCGCFIRVIYEAIVGLKQKPRYHLYTTIIWVAGLPAAAENEERFTLMSALQDVTLSVPDVSCEHCVKTINGALSKESGVEFVETSVPTKSVHVRFDSDTISMTRIEEILDDAGYAVAKA